MVKCPLTISGRKEKDGKNQAAFMYTLIYFLPFYDIEGQKRSANDIDIKKKDSLSGRPSKGNWKGIRAHEQARAREK